MALNITHDTEAKRWTCRIYPFSWQEVAIVKAAGWRFNSLNKSWWTDRPEIAAKLAGGAESAADAINAERHLAQAKLEEAIQASRAASSDLVLPLSAECKRLGYDYLPYQRAGVQFALPRSGVLIGDEMGLGKTIQALGLINADEKIVNVLIVVPATVRKNWLRECLRWLVRRMPMHIVTGAKGQVLPRGGVCIVSYDAVSKLRPWIDGIAWDLLVCDEAHYLKNPKSLRTISILGRRDKEVAKRVPAITAGRRVFMTGTPIPNRPIEIWPVVQALDPEGLGRSWKGFATTYCNGHQKLTPGRYGRMIWDVMGASRLPELQARLRSSIMIRRMKADVLPELPPKRRAIVPLDASGATAQAALLAEAGKLDGKMAELRAAVEALSADQASDAYKLAADAFAAHAETVPFTQMSAIRHETALAKVEPAIAHCLDCLESEEKLVVFAHHHDCIDALCEGLAEFNPVRADARDDCDASVQRFQNDPATRVIVCGILAMGQAHTLTAASHVVFCEMPFVPGQLQQAEDRLHRIGQRDNVFVQHLVLEGSLDERIMAIVVHKMDILDLALNQGEKLPPVKEVAPPPPPAPDVQAGPVMPPEQVAAVHTALKMLAGMCDGARALDGAGFNRFDTAIGHSLAAWDKLSQRQAFVGRKLVWKYKKQLPADLFQVIKGE